MTKLLNTAQAAEYLGIKYNTLNQWRYLKRGPRFSKVGAAVRYSINDLENYLEQNTRTSTTRQGLRTY
ncbi:MAG: helix-turn-helix domain-containing protein [Thiolinea sp.]